MGEEDVGWELHQNIANEEKCNRRGVLGRGQIETLGHPGDLCSSDIVLVSHDQTSVFVMLKLLTAAFVIHPRRSPSTYTVEVIKDEDEPHS